MPDACSPRIRSSSSPARWKELFPYAHMRAFVLLAAAFVPATFFIWLITDHFKAGSVFEWHPGWVQDDPDNDPHVCRFHISGSNFDKNSSGTWHVEVWSPGGGALAAAQTAGTWSANALGKFDAFPAQPFPSGHYKLGVKQNTPSSPGGEKQKVFWVRCGTTAEVASTTVAARENEEQAATSNANAVAGVETAPSAVAAVASVSASPATTSGTVAGIQSLPSTSTSEAAPLLMSGALIAAVGGLLILRTAQPGR